MIQIVCGIDERIFCKLPNQAMKSFNHRTVWSLCEWKKRAGWLCRAEGLCFHHRHIASWYWLLHVMFVSRFTASILIQSSCFPTRRLNFFCMGNKTGLRMQADTAPIPTETPSQRRRCAEGGAHKVGSKAGLSCPPKTEVIRTGCRAAATRRLHSEQVSDPFHCPWLWGPLQSRSLGL